MARNPRRRPPELVAASTKPVRLAGRPTAVSAAVPAPAEPLLDAAARTTAPASEQKGAILNVEDIRSLGNPGVVYGVYLNLPDNYTERDRDRHHVGNITTFGIEQMNSLDPEHDHVPGMRHSFDMTRRLRVLRRAGRVRRGEPLRVSFLPELPEPPPGYPADKAAKIQRDLMDDAALSPIVVGRVSVFVD